MVVVALSLFGARMYRRISRYRWAANVYASEAAKERATARTLDALGSESAQRSAAFLRERALFMEEESRRFAWAAWLPWTEVKSGRPPKDPSSP